jgi:hypothetical protein
MSAQTAEDSNLCSAATSLTLENKSRCIYSLSRGDGPGDWNPLRFRRCRVYRLRRLVASRRQNSSPRRDISVRASSDALHHGARPYGSPLHLPNACPSRRVGFAAVIALDATARNSDELAISP